MDCNCNQRCASCRPQQMPPPYTNMNCGCHHIPTTLPTPAPAPRPEPVRPIPPSSCGAKPPMISPYMQAEQIKNMPIGMAYVPWQQWRKTYPLEQALVRGTIFPELDLPFMMGRCK